MPSERWLQIERLYHLALEQQADSRAAFVVTACGGDEGLRQEVESLLAHGDDSDAFLEMPAVQVAAKARAQDEERWDMTGKTVCHYRIIEEIGAGGMAVVYLARDETLDRQVALKVLPPGALAGQDARKRLRKEALALAKLSHPNIETIYELGSQDGVDFLVTEYIAGMTLADRIASGPLPEAELVDIAVQIGSALEDAAGNGLVHLDLKPRNMMLTPKGRVKLLDFGLARLVKPKKEDRTQSLTNVAIAAGTPPYMAPEQLLARPLDVRTDIYSVGASLYELATGRQPFRANSLPELIAAILHDPANPPSSIRPDLSPALERVILKCLQKTPEERYQTVGALLADLHSLEAGPLAAVPMPIPSSPGAPGDSARIPRDLATSVAQHSRGLMAHAKSLAIAAAVLAVGGVLWYALRSKPPITERDSIVLADFENRTGDTAFDGTMKKVLEVAISQSPHLNILPDQSVQQGLALMRRRADEPITKQVGLEICQRSSAKAVISGSIASLGSRYVLTLEALDCATGDVLAGATAEADTKERVLTALDKGTSKMRRKLGESLASIQKFSAPIEEATTGSLDALKMFTVGDDLRRQGKAAESLPFFKRAVELDPQFTLAYGRLGAVYANLDDSPRAKQYLEQAFQLRERTSERERLYLTARYYEIVTGETAKLLDNYEVWRNAYPRDWIPANNLANEYTRLGQYDKAIEAAREAVKLNPNHAFPYTVLARAYKRATRYAESKSVCGSAFANHLEGSGLHSILYQIAFAEKDTAAMQRQVEWGTGKPTEDETLMEEAMAAAAAGRLRESRELSRRALLAARTNGFPNHAAIAEVSQASVEVLFHNFSEAKERARAALGIEGAKVSDDAALVLAWAGDLTRAESIADDLVRENPLDTLVNEVSVPRIRAEVEIRRGQFARAIDLLRSATRFELRDFTIPYIRGMANLLARNGADAAREFQKILKNQGVDPTSPYYPLAHIGLAQSSELEGDKAASRREYEEFFVSWKGADPDIPILREARSAYGELVRRKALTPPH